MQTMAPKNAPSPPRTPPTPTQIKIAPGASFALSFSGCGFLGVYHLGAAKCLAVHAGTLLKHVTRYAGCSAGSLVATLLLTAPHRIEDACHEFYKFSDHISKLRFGALEPDLDFMGRLENVFDSLIPPDADKIAGDRLYFSVTKTADKTNMVVNRFSSRTMLIKYAMASCYIPVYAGTLGDAPVVEGQQLIDGGFSNNLLRFPAMPTVSVSPFCSDADISPRDVNLFDWTMTIANQSMKVNLKNLLRGARALFPPKRPVLEEYYRLGFINTMQYLKSHSLFERPEGTPV